MRNLPLVAIMVVSLSAIAQAPAAPDAPPTYPQEQAPRPEQAPQPDQAPAPEQAPPPDQAPGPEQRPAYERGPAAGTPSPFRPSPGDLSRIPAYAIPSLGLETSVAWKGDHDEQTRGSSNGQTNYPVFPDGRNGMPGRQFVSWYGNKAGERFHLAFGRDPNATHFVYAANVYLVDPGEVDNVEMDMNQVMSDGRTVIFGTQCAAHSRSWEYTYVDRSGTHWHPSNIRCDPHDWGKKKWHRVQIGTHRDEGGNVSYDWVNFDGVYTDFQGANAYSARALRWTPGQLLLNFQIDGSRKKGVMDAYLNNLAVYRW